ncbi:MAG TPA: permease-like cell division protein FtsX [Mycobacteriales bacterium]|nr:permease-like cell division protein FtsX [Mycobacteriales bacterium]
MRASFFLSEIGIGLRRNMTMTIAMIVTMALSLFLQALGLGMTRQVSAMKDFWYDRVEISVYLCGESSVGATCGGTPVTDEQRREIGDDLRQMPQVREVFYESQQDAYDRFREQFADSPDLVDNVTADALPESYRVSLHDPEQFEVVASALRDRPGIEQVQDQKALLEPFFRILNLFQFGAWALAGSALLAAVLLVSNTVRVSAFGRRREVGIMRLVGASNWTIQLPFVLEGLLAGVVGAVIASGGLVAVKAIAVDRFLREELPFTAFIGWGDVLWVVPWLFLTGIVLAGLASFLTLRRHLRV